MTPTIRRLDVGEAALYRTVRLESLRDSPEAFGSRYEDAVSRSDQSWVDQADGTATGSDRATFVALSNRPVGLAALYRDSDEPEVGELIQMWVAPESRGGSTSWGLLSEVFRWAGMNHFSVVKAEVIRGNTRAIKFYEKFGFVISADELVGSAASLVLTKQVEQVAAPNRLTRSGSDFHRD